MAESLCQKRALEAFRLDPKKWGGSMHLFNYFCLLRNPTLGMMASSLCICRFTYCVLVTIVNSNQII